jgi:hypothetical protein
MKMAGVLRFLTVLSPDNMSLLGKERVPQGLKRVYAGFGS